MKVLPPGLADHLASGATTLCWCWRLVRADGIVTGFTDHDRALVFDGTTYEARAGFSASEIRESVGLSVDNLEVEGGVTSERLAEDDLAAGLYDDARVEIYRVNWQDPDQRVLVRAGSLGEVRRTEQAFVAEIRGLAHYLQQPKGRLYQYTCDADVGDVRCGVDLETASFQANATVTSAVSDHEVVVSGLEEFADGWFDHGILVFLGGENEGQRFEIKRHLSEADAARLVVWHALGRLPEPGDLITVRAGCNRTLETCRGKFGNAVNFRGFPHMPGNDFVTTIHGGS